MTIGPNNKTVGQSNDRTGCSFFRSLGDPNKLWAAILIVLASTLPLLIISCSGRGVEYAVKGTDQVAKTPPVEMPVAWVSAFGVSALAIGAILRANQNISGTSAARLLVLTTIVIAVLAIILLIPESRKDQFAPAYALLGSLAGYMLKDKDDTDKGSPRGDSGGEEREK